MCRLLALKSRKPMALEEHLNGLAKIAKTSEQWQGDGWGIVYADEKGGFSSYRSLVPMWEDGNKFSHFPKTRFALVHARGAFVAASKVLENVHPFEEDGWFFMMNGHIEGVRLSLPGSIGAKKVFALLRAHMARMEPLSALQETERVIRRHSRFIAGMNCILSNGKQVFVLCRHGERAEYYTLQVSQSDALTIVSSKAYGEHVFRGMENGECLEL